MSYGMERIGISWYLLSIRKRMICYLSGTFKKINYQKIIILIFEKQALISLKSCLFDILFCNRIEDADLIFHEFKIDNFIEAITFISGCFGDQFCCIVKTEMEIVFAS